mgnify:CR=1 FL=1
MPEAKIIKEPISIDALVNSLKELDEEKRAGAVVVFVGVVKGVVDKEKVDYLEYEAYVEKALEEMNRIARELSSREGVIDVKIYHRIDKLKPGEDIVYIAVSGVNRETAFSTAWEAIDRVKHEVPIWKKEVKGGKGVWVLGEGHRVSEDKL